MTITILESPKFRQLGAIDKVHNIISSCKNFSPKNIMEIRSGDRTILQGFSEKSLEGSYTH
jgi:hypothetical protein